MRRRCEDQELFDELAGEQVLKEMLEEPGAKQRLLAALGPPEQAKSFWWARPWPWMAAAVSLAIVIVLVVSNRAVVPRPQVVAQVLKSEERVPEAVRQAEPPPAPVRTRKAEPEELSKDATVAEDSLQAQAAAPVRDDAAQPRAKAEAIAEARPVPAPQTVGAVGGAARAFAPANRVAENLAANVVSVFGFNYTLRAGGILEILPSSAGFLSVAGANVILPNTSVMPGTPVRIQIPAEAASLMIGFFATPGITAGVPVRKDGTSGTVTDQDPPNGRIAIELFLTPATR